MSNQIDLHRGYNFDRKKHPTGYIHIVSHLPFKYKDQDYRPHVRNALRVDFSKIPYGYKLMCFRTTNKETMEAPYVLEWCPENTIFKMNEYFHGDELE